MFTCIECQNSYTPDISGDAEERTCYDCMQRADEIEDENQLEKAEAILYSIAPDSNPAYIYKQVLKYKKEKQ